jgi:hypothetical protein
VSEVRHELRLEIARYIAEHFDPDRDLSEFWGRAIHAVLGGPVYASDGTVGVVVRRQFSERQLERLVAAGQEIYLLAEEWRERYPEVPEPRSDGWAALLALSETCGMPPPREATPVEPGDDDGLRITYLAVTLWLINVHGGLAESTFAFFPEIEDAPVDLR